jgi:hypothetical protein
MKIILLVLSVLSLLACDVKTDFENKLIKSKWVVYSDANGRKEQWPNSYFRFYADGKFDILHLPSDVSLPVTSEGQEQLHDWRYEPEHKKLVISGYEFNVIAIEADTIRMIKDTSRVILYNIDNTYTKLKKGPGRCLGG